MEKGAMEEVEAEEERGKGRHKEGRKGERTLRRSRDLEIPVSYSHIDLYPSSMACNLKHLS